MVVVRNGRNRSSGTNTLIPKRPRSLVEVIVGMCRQLLTSCVCVFVVNGAARNKKKRRRRTITTRRIKKIQRAAAMMVVDNNNRQHGK